jgi:hypothetical protein
MVVLATKLHKAIPKVGASAYAVLKHTLLVVRLYYIRSSLAVGSSRLCSKDLSNSCVQWKSCLHI